MLFLRGPESRDAPWLTRLSHVGKLVAALGRSVGLNRSERGFPRHRARWRKENAAASFRPPLLNRQGVPGCVRSELGTTACRIAISNTYTLDLGLLAGSSSGAAPRVCLREN